MYAATWNWTCLFPGPKKLCDRHFSLHKTFRTRCGMRHCGCTANTKTGLRIMDTIKFGKMLLSFCRFCRLTEFRRSSYEKQLIYFWHCQRMLAAYVRTWTCMHWELFIHVFPLLEIVRVVVDKRIMRGQYDSQVWKSLATDLPLTTTMKFRNGNVWIRSRLSPPGHVHVVQSD